MSAGRAASGGALGAVGWNYGLGFGRERPRSEQDARLRDIRQPVDAERAPAVPVEGPARQVPVPVRGHERVRMHG